MNHRRRLTALECLHKSRQPAPPDLAKARKLFRDLHVAWGPPGVPVPELTDAEILAFALKWDASLAAAIDEAYSDRPAGERYA